MCSDDVKAHFSDPSIVATSDAGAMWSDETVTTVMALHLNKENPDRAGFGLDGYVRSPGQLNFLMDYIQRRGWSIVVVWIDTPAEICTERVATRRLQFIDKGLKPRRDDDPDVHDRRLKEYDEYGPATLKAFEDAGVLVKRIDGTMSPEEVVRESHTAIFG